MNRMRGYSPPSRRPLEWSAFLRALSHDQGNASQNSDGNPLENLHFCSSVVLGLAKACQSVVQAGGRIALQ